MSEASKPTAAEILAVAENGPGVKLYETETGKEIRELLVAAGVVSFSWDGKSLATASDSSVKIWDLRNGNELQTIAGQLNARDVAFGSNSKILITGGDSIGLW